MQLHQLRPKHKSKKKKRVGRGGKKGSYSGKGIKGQKSRAGRKMEPVIRGLIKKYPKLRGYRVKSKSQKSKPVILNLEKLEKKFNAGETVNPSTLLEKGLIRRIKGRIPEVKILGKDKITKALIVEGCKVSESARKKIEEVKGTVK